VSEQTGNTVMKSLSFERVRHQSGLHVMVAMTPFTRYRASNHSRQDAAFVCILMSWFAFVRPK